MSNLVSIYGIVMISIFASCNGSTGKSNDSQKTSLDSMSAKDNHPPSGKVYTAQIFKNTDGTYGYTILENNSAIIQQAVIPALSGNSGFPDSLKANNTARLVMDKLNRNIFPPSVTAEEIKTILNQ